jgi:hypothetical protein
LLRIYSNKLADRPEHTARVAARKAINGKPFDDPLPAPTITGKESTDQ